MTAQRTTRMAGLALVLLVAASFGARAQSSDRIFADGFDPCCRIGGTVSGLAGSGLSLNLAAGAVSENLPIAGNGLYDFAASVPTGTAYTVSIDSQPAGQACTVANATGTMGTSPVGNIDVSCGAVPALIWDQGDWGQDWQ